MTASVLQENFADDAFGSGTAVTSLAMAANGTLGSTLVAWVTVSATATNPSTVIDSAGQHYTFRKSVFNAVAGNQQLALYTFENNASATKLTVTATWLAAQTGKGAWLGECGGVPAASYDNSVLAIANAPGTGANLVTSGTATPTGATTLCYGFAMECNIGNGSDLAAGTAYSLLSSGWKFGGTPVLAKSESKRITSAVATAATMTAATNGGTGIYLVGLVFLDEASGTNLTGQTATFTEGTVSRAISTALTGQTATSSEGTIARAVASALTGQSATFAEGTPTGAVSYSLTGQTATFSEGTITASTGGNVTLSLTGQSATFSEGSITGSLSAALTGQSITSSEGSPSAAISYSTAGQSATFTEGAPTAAWGGSAALTAQTATFSEGTLAPNAALGLSGQSASFTPGSLTPAASFGVLGQTASFTEGTITVQAGGDVTLSLSGLTASFSQGLFSVTGGDVSNVGAGRRTGRRHLERYIVRIDSQEFVCFSKAEALEILRKAQEAAKLFALNRIAKADFPNIELPTPKITVNTRELRSEAAQTKAAITATYRQVLIDTELKMLFELDKRQQDDDETILLLM